MRDGISRDHELVCGKRKLHEEARCKYVVCKYVVSKYVVYTIWLPTMVLDMQY